MQRNPTSQLVNLQENYFLIDCAEGTQLQMRKYSVKFQRISRIFISHLHGDHYLGLIGLIQSMHLLGRTKELHIHANEHLKEIIEINNKASETYLKFPIKFHPLSYKEKTLIHEDSKCKVFSFPLKHRIPTCGFLFEEKEKSRNIIESKIRKYNIPTAYINGIKNGADFTLEDGTVIPNKDLTSNPAKIKKYAYCSDTAFKENLVEDIMNCDLIYHEATFLNDMKVRAKETYHSTALQAAQIAKKAKAKQLVLGHFSVRYKGVKGFLEEATSVFPRTILAEDGLSINI